MNLVIDIGNSSVKAALFNSGKIISTSHWEGKYTESLVDLLESNPDINNAIISSVRKNDGGISEKLDIFNVPVLLLDVNTPLPIANLYRTNQTLGRDRIAAAVGANYRFRNKNLLVIDAGTAITIDFVSSGNEFLGGNISPGMSMRLRALHEFTDKLPLVKPSGSVPLLGDDTESAILAGVVNGIIFEIDEYVNRQKIRYPDLKVVLTGGDAMFFDKKLKNSIFVDLNLNLQGLHRILDYNVDR